MSTKKQAYNSVSIQEQQNNVLKPPEMSFKQRLYDSKTGKYMGRTSSSWCKFIFDCCML